MLQIKNEVRDEICRALQGQVVSAPTGALLMQVSAILMQLPECKCEDKDKKDDKNKETKGGNKSTTA